MYLLFFLSNAFMIEHDHRIVAWAIRCYMQNVCKTVKRVQNVCKTVHSHIMTNYHSGDARFISIGYAFVLYNIFLILMFMFRSVFLLCQICRWFRFDIFIFIIDYRNEFDDTCSVILFDHECLFHVTKRCNPNNHKTTNTGAQ